MNKFVKHILKILFVVIVSTCLLDFIYTKVYETSKERNKVQAIINGNIGNFDVVILGSSRAQAYRDH